jgi:predicted transglutaminase-like cysteine proteinase
VDERDIMLKIFNTHTKLQHNIQGILASLHRYNKKPYRKMLSGNTPITYTSLCARKTATLFLVLIFIVFFSSTVINAAGPIVFTQALFESIRVNYGDDAQKRVKDWQEILDDNRDKDIDEQLYSINRFFNRLEFVDDLKHWNKNDYWATPVEFLSTNGGDCEDFSIAKYFSLRDMGVSAEKLRLMYVKALRYNMAHMVLAYYETPKSIPLILDNLNKDILPANKRRDLRPVYSFNGEGLWIAKEQGRGKQVQEGGNNVLWEDLKKRMIQELNNKYDK